MDPFCLENINIVISGASSGIGRQCAVSCSLRGAKILLLGRDKTKLEETLKLMKNRQQHLIRQIDLTEYDAVEEILGNATNHFGKLNGVVNCAGISTTIPFTYAKPGKIEEYFNVNVQAAFNLTRLAVKPAYFSESGGSIIFLSSVMGIVGEVGKTIYSMTKGSVISGSKSLSLELAPKRIRVNCISPGVVETPMSKNAVYSSNEESWNKMKALHPLGLGQPEDIANACIYLLSDASRWVTGTNLVVDGGYLAR